MSVRRLPMYRHHKARNLAKVRINGREIYLGEYNSPESLRKYDQLVGDFLAGREITTDHGDAMTVEQLAVRYLSWIENRYREATRHVVRSTVKALREEFGRFRCTAFDAPCLIRLQDRLIERKLSRKYVNEVVNQVKRIFRWALVRKYVVADQVLEMTSVENLKRGQSQAQERGPIRPVSNEDIERTLAHLPNSVADLVRFQRLTACRPGEARSLRPCDVDRSGEVWIYRPAHHKTEHFGKMREIPLGPRVQKLLLPRLLRPENAYCFSSDSEGKRSYTKDTYARAISRGCIKAGVDHWHPNQIRHTAATEIRRQFGLEAAQVALGHAHAAVTQIYAERNLTKATEVAMAIG